MEWYQKPIPAARTFKLGDRRDGVTGAIGVARYRPGEVLGLAIDASAQLGTAWLTDLDDVDVLPVGEVEGTISVSDSRPHEQSGLLLVDATEAVVGERFVLHCNLYFSNDEWLTATLLVLIDDD